LVAVVVLAGVLFAASFSSLSAQVAQPVDSKAITQVLTGNFRIEYVVASGTERLDGVRRIEFHETYFVVFGSQEQGNVIPLNGLLQFRWEPA
jgi:type IV secretory pathway VirB2 component (pilin)